MQKLSGRLRLLARLLVIQAAIGHGLSFQIPDSITSALTYKLHQRLNVYASDLYSDPLNPRLSQEAKFSEYFQDPLALANSQPTFLQKLFRDNYYNTSFRLNFRMNEYCKELWSLSSKRDGFLEKPLYYKLFVDSFPVSLTPNFTRSVFSKNKVPSRFAIPILMRKAGSTKNNVSESLIVLNHLRLIVYIVDVDRPAKQNTTTKDEQRVDKFAISHIEALPMSIRQKKKGDPENSHLITCAYGDNMLSQAVPFLHPEIKKLGTNSEEHEIKFTYDVVFKMRNSLAFRTRFDDLRKGKTVLEVNVLFSTLIIIGLIVAIVSTLRNILRRVVDQRPSEAEERETILKTEGGDPNNAATFRGSRKIHSSIHLKVIKNDVFRQPTFPRVYSILFGLGLQLSIALLATSLSVVLFFKSEANRATILVILMTFYLCSGIILGFASSKMYMTINGLHWLSIALITSILIPGMVVACLFIVDYVMWLEGSYFLITFNELIWVPFYWIGLFVPQVYFGSYLGFNTKKTQFPCSVSLVPRSTESTPWYMENGILALMGGCFPFMVFYFTAYFLFYGIWINDAYSMISVHLLFFSVLLYLIVSSLVGIISTLACFLHEKHEWWWASFHSAGGIGIWTYVVQLYASLIGQLSTNTTSTWTEFAIFNTLNLFFSLFIYLISGSVGTLSALVFVKHIYNRLKLD